MNPGHAPPVAFEALISAVITVAMNSLMTFVIFHGAGPISTWGLGGVAFALAPTTFMSVLMSAIVLGGLTEKRVRAARAVRRYDRRPVRGPRTFLRVEG